MGQTNDRPSKSKGTSPRVDKAPRFNQSQFIQYELDDAQQKECKAWQLAELDLFMAVQEEVDNGYKFSVKWDTYGECYSAFMQPAADGHRNSGCILTGRGSTAYKAVKQLLYKQRFCLQDDWSGHVGRNNRFDIDD